LIEVIRIVEDQTKLYSYRATQDEEHAAQLELLIETTKPRDPYLEWHPLISTPFRYNPPYRNARFRPPFGKNIFYSALIEETALYEHAFHFMRQRIHLDITDTGTRTLFSVVADERNAVQLRYTPNLQSLIDKNDYIPSHQFVQANPNATFILYPSCRDPKQRDNAAILDIHLLEKNPTWEAPIHYFYNNQKQQLTWIDYQLSITWSEVC
jgi:hypothetical protein